MSLVLNDLSNLNWTNDTSYLFLNSKLPRDDISLIYDAIAHIDDPSHIYLATSGTSNMDCLHKIVALHKDAFLNSAQSINDVFQIHQTDVLLNILPTFHVGGLSLFARAFYANARVINAWHNMFKWDPSEFVKQCINTQATVTSLVPTQIFDLVKINQSAPNSLRCIFVGGSAISTELFCDARTLGWPIYPTYGMTECCSQVATFDPTSSIEKDFHVKENAVLALPSIPLKVLPHIDLCLDQESKIKISGSSLLDYYVTITKDRVDKFDPKIQGWLKTNDVGRYENNYLNVFGRSDDNIKINGEFVNTIRINEKFQTTMIKNDLCVEHVVTHLHSERTGADLVAVFLKADYAHKEKIKQIQSDYNQNVFSHERIHRLQFVDQIPKTDLGKIQIQKLKTILNREPVHS